jgi:hypothetical protein
MTAVQLALCDPTWDPDPDDEDDGPYCGITTHRARRSNAT